MSTIPHKSSTDVNDLNRISDLIAKMPGSTAPPPGGADKQACDASRTRSLADQSGLGVATPNPGAGNSAVDDTVRPRITPKATNSGKPLRRARRVKKNPKTPGSPATANVPPWYPPHFYPPWYPPPYQFPYSTPPTHHPSHIDPGATSHPSAPKPSYRFRSRTSKTPQENPERGRSAQLGEEQAERNLLSDFNEAGSEYSEKDEVPEGGGSSGGDEDDEEGDQYSAGGDDDDDEDDEDWEGYSSEESEEESYTKTEDTSDTGSSIPLRTRQTYRKTPASNRKRRQAPPTVNMAAIRDMVRKGVARELAEMNVGKSKRRDPRLGMDEGPLSKRIYRASMADFKYPTTLPSFRGSGDIQDPQNFVHSFQERLRLLGATDPIMCRIFTTCLSGEAWDWYIALPRESIQNFKHLARAFLERYTVIKPPQITSEMLLDIVQEPGERTRTFVNLFIQKSRKIQNLNEEFAVAAIKKGLRKGGPGTLRYDACRKNVKTLRDFVAFAEGYIRAEEDEGSFERSRSRSPRGPIANAKPRRDKPRGQDPPRQLPPRREEVKRDFGEERYRPHFTRYAPFTRKRNEMFHIVRERFNLPRPLPNDIFEILDVNKRCLYHNSEGHSTGECLQLKDILERLAREGKLTEFINPDFYKKHTWRYNGRARDFNRKIPYRGEVENRRPPREPRRDDIGESRQQVRPTSPVINMISGGNVHAVRGPVPRRKAKPYPTVLVADVRTDRKRPRAEEVISFSDKDQRDIIGPHDDPIVLTLKVGTHRVKRIMIDTGSSADILYLSAFEKMGVRPELLQKVVAPLIGFTGDTLRPKGMVQLKVAFGTSPKVVEVMVDFLVVDAPSAYKAILGRGTLNRIGAIVCSPHLKVKFYTDHGIGEECGQQKVARECYLTSITNCEGSVHQVEKKPSAKTTPRDSQVKSSTDFMAPGTELSWEPTDKTETKTQIEPTDEVEQVELAAGKYTNIGKAVQGDARKELVNFLRDNQSVFAWTSADMPGIPRDIAEHKLHLIPGAKPVRQKKRNMGEERQLAVKKEVKKLLEAGVIRNVHCPEWTANPVLVKKPNGDWRMCIDYTDLNKACPMDPFPLPKIDQLVDSTSGHAFLSFMDAFSGYNQIRMCQEDEAKTAFTTHSGLYCYKMMPFGLRNAGATFQRMVNKVFDKKIGRNMEAYVDDLLVKSMSDFGHIEDLRETFATLNGANMKLNPKKSFFGLTGGKFLGFMVSMRGIEIHPSKSAAILDMKPPKNLKELQTLTGRLAALNRFIARSGDVCFPFFKAMRKSSRFEWTEECDVAFQKVKEYLANPPCLSRPSPGESFVVYLATTGHAVSAALVREEGKEQRPIYFVSHVLRDAETRYTQIEKAAFALVKAARKLRPYFQSHPIKVFTGVPLEKAFANFESSGRLLTWALELSEFDITFHPQNSLKSQIFADFIAEYFRMPAALGGRWKLYVDGASSLQGAGAGVSLQGPQGEMLNYALHFQFLVTNNTAEYEALIAGLRLAREVGAREAVSYTHLR